MGECNDHEHHIVTVELSNGIKLRLSSGGVIFDFRHVPGAQRAMHWGDIVEVSKQLEEWRKTMGSMYPRG